MKSYYKWTFPSANNTGTYGLRSYQEEFKDNPMFSLAKEICQNSLDAVDDESHPVLVEFNLFWLKKEDFPKRDDFVEVLYSCRHFSKKNYKNTDQTEFYNDAIGIMSDDEIPVLRISDFNTKGLTGSDNKDNSDWSNLVKAVGVSDKGDGKGGSFGHGKFATFACSYLQTVFYSTCAVDGIEVSQGVARLSSFYDKNDDKTMGLGYFGEDNCEPMMEFCNFDKSFRREYGDCGTDIYIMGFDVGIFDWKEKVIAAVIDAFYVAVLNKRLVFKLNDVLINAETIQSLVESEIYKEYLNPETLYNFYSFFDEKRVLFTGSIKNENDVMFYFLPFKDQECPNRVAMVRMNGMKIFDQDHLPQSPFFGGTLLINNKRTDAYLRALENPQHSGWSDARAKNPIEAKEVIKNLRKFLRDSINQYVQENTPDFIDVSGLSEYLPDDIDVTDNEISNESDNLSDERNKKTEAKKVNIGKKNNKNEKKSDEEILAEILIDGEEEEILPIPVDPNPNPNPTPNPLPPTPVNIEKVFRAIKGINTRLYVSNNKYHLNFSLKENAKDVIVCIKLSGETSDSDDLRILSADILEQNCELKVERNKITIKDLKTLNNIKVDFAIDSDEMWPVEVTYYAIEK